MYKQSIQNNALPHFNKNKYLYLTFLHELLLSLHDFFDCFFYLFKTFPAKKKQPSNAVAF